MQISSKRQDTLALIALLLFLAVLFGTQSGDLIGRGRAYIATEKSSFTVESVKSTESADGYTVNVRSQWWWNPRNYTLQCHHCSRPAVGDTIRLNRTGQDTFIRSIPQSGNDLWGARAEFYTILEERK